MYKIYRDTGDFPGKHAAQFYITAPSGKTMYILTELGLEDELRSFMSAASTHPTLDKALSPTCQQYVTEASTFGDAFNIIKLLELTE